MDNFNSVYFNQEHSLAAIVRLEAVLKRERAELWMNHDKARSICILHAPDFVELGQYPWALSYCLFLHGVFQGIQRD